MPSGVYEHPKGENHPKWKGGTHTIKEKINDYNRERRHRLGISKRFLVRSGLSKTIEYKRFHRKKYKALRTQAGDLSVKTIQMVYEDNIKKYGTLTCYLCEKPIEFGKDHLEHKTPLSRNGTNEYENLCVSCSICNCKKGRKTYEEFLNRCRE